MTLGAVLFDLDDTLHDDTAAQLGGAQRVADDLAKQFDTLPSERVVAAYLEESDLFWKSLGTGTLAASLGDLRTKMWGRALVRAGLPPDDALAKRCGERYNGYRRELFTLFPETLELLRDLRARGVKIGMITNGVAETHREKIVLLELESVFDLVFIADEVGFTKPDPEIFTLASERIGVPLERCAMVGDRYDRDIRTPLALGMFTIWTNVRGESVPHGEPPPHADLPGLAGVALALAPHLPPLPARGDAR